MRTLQHWWAGQTPVCQDCQRRVLLEDTDEPERFAEDFPEAAEGSLLSLTTATFRCPCGGEVSVQRMEHEFEAKFPVVVA